MTDEHNELPDNPLSSYDIEQITKEAGGEVIAVLQRAHQDRLTIGAYEHPHKMKSLNMVTIRMYRDGKPTDGVDLSFSETQSMITALLEAISVCWGIAPRDAVEPPDNEPPDET